MKDMKDKAKGRPDDEGLEDSASEVAPKGEPTDEQVAESRVQDIAQAAPPATEPLEPQVLSRLGQAVAKAMDTFSDGQIPKEELQQLQATEGDGSKVPPMLFAAGFFLQQAMGQAGEAAGKYQFDMAGATTNEAIDEIAAAIDAAASDAGVVRAMQGPAQAAAPSTPAGPAPKSAGQGPGIDALL